MSIITGSLSGLTSTFVQVSKTEAEKTLTEGSSTTSATAATTSDQAEKTISSSQSSGGLAASETGRVRADSTVARNEASRSLAGDMRRPVEDQVSAERAAAQASVDKMKKELLVAQIAKAPEVNVELSLVEPVEKASKEAYSEGKSAKAGAAAAAERLPSKVDARA